VQELLRQKEEQQEGGLADDALFAAAGGAGTAEAAAAAAAAAAEAFVPLTPEQQKVRSPTAWQASWHKQSSSCACASTALHILLVSPGGCSSLNCRSMCRPALLAVLTMPVVTHAAKAVVHCLTGGRSASVILAVIAHVIRSCLQR
jgi:hypothetical protein